MAARAGAPRARALLRANGSPAWCEHVRPLCTTSRWSGTPSHAAQAAAGLRSGSGRRRGGGVGGGAGRAQGWRLGPWPGQHLMARGGLLPRLATSWRL